MGCVDYLQNYRSRERAKLLLDAQSERAHTHSQAVTQYDAVVIKVKAYVLALRNRFY